MSQQISFLDMSEDEIIQFACATLERRLGYRREAIAFQGPGDVRDFLKLKLTQKESEVFAVLFLDNRHRLIQYEEMFFGTINGASVHPREVVKAALRHNAAAVVFAHNHPSGVSEPSQADISLTKKLTEALALVDVRALDHFIVSYECVLSMAERGLI